jgi:hypothetical protein
MDEAMTPGGEADAPSPADAQLLDELRRVASAVDPVPDDAVLAARSALAYLRLDAALADLVHDSEDDHDLSVVGFRSAGTTARQLAFQSGPREIELEVIEAGDRRRLIGQCIPAGTVEVTTRIAGGEHRTTVSDDLGRFSVELPKGLVSLRCVWPATDPNTDIGTGTDDVGVIETGWVRV